MNEEKLEVEVENEEPTEVEIEDAPVAEEPPDEEIQSYSAKVQKRIKELTAQKHEERRAKEEALVFAKSIADENARLKERLSSGEKTLINTMQVVSEKELEESRKKYKEALYTGDADKIASAVEEFNKAVLRSERVKNVQPEAERPAQNYVDTKAERWKNTNRWFGQPGQPGVNNEMTHFAMGVHKDLVQQHGDLYASTDDYYERITSRVREKFPEYFQGNSEKNRPASVVAPASRSSPPKKLRLTASEASMAKRLGVSLQSYAEQVAKLRMEGKI